MVFLMFLAWLNHFHFHSDILGKESARSSQEESGKNEEGDEPDTHVAQDAQLVDVDAWARGCGGAVRCSIKCP